MAFIDRLKEARLQKGFTQEQIAQKIGVAKSTYTGYERGTREPNVNTIGILMEKLGVDANYLWQDETDSSGGSPMKLKYNEIQHIEKYRFISEYSPSGKETVDYILNREYEVAEMIKDMPAAEQQDNIPSSRIINYYYRLASAGTGQILFDTPPTKRIEIPNIPRYAKADYAIGVNGDSMKPTYNDGDMLLVEMTDTIEIGEIGIFYVDGECYVKKLGEKELISLNPEYNNVPLNETAKCMGRVIDKL